MRQKWSKDITVETIQQLHRSGERLSSHRIQLCRPTLYRAAIVYFGGWGKAISASGLNYDDIRIRRPFRKWSAGAIIQEILNRHRSGLSISYSSVAKQDYGLYHAAVRYLGNWSKALQLAGFNPSDFDPRRIWTKDSILKEIQNRHRANLPLYLYGLQKSKEYGLLGAACKLFGSWKMAIMTAGLDYDKIRMIRQNYWNKRRIITEIRYLKNRGIRLNSSAIHSSRGDLFAAAICHFGTWGQAVESAGFRYREHCKTWTYKSWLRELSSEQFQKLDDRVVQLAKIRRGTK